MDPLLGRQGELHTFHGDGSDVLVREALHLMQREAREPHPRPVFVAVHYAAPHDPWFAQPTDQRQFYDLIRCKTYSNPKACAPKKINGVHAAPVYPIDCDCFTVHHVLRYYGELHALDRSIGAMRKGLRGLGIENRTLLWFSSDNGEIKPRAVNHTPPRARTGLRSDCTCRVEAS